MKIMNGFLPNTDQVLSHCTACDVLEERNASRLTQRYSIRKEEQRVQLGKKNESTQ